MGSFSKGYSSTRRSIRKIWHKELLYFRSNHPLFILAFIVLFAGFYNLWWRHLPEIPADTGKTTVSNIKVFDNLRLTKHKFVRVLICIGNKTVDYRFSTVTDAIHLTHLDYPDVEFTKSEKEAEQRLRSGEFDILILFTKLIETGKHIEYNIISSGGDLNKHYCIICDNHRKLSWGHAIEAQTVTNRFLYWLIKARGFSTRRPHWQLSNVYVEEEEVDHLFAKRQTDLFVAWLILLPICARLIDSWNDDRTSGFYKVLLSLGTRRVDYFTAKFQFWYAFSLIISCIVWAVNISVVHGSFTSTYFPFMVIYIACIFAFTIFLATLFPNSPLFAKFVGLLLMAAGEFGFGEVYHGIPFFQLSVRFFGKSSGDAHWDDSVALMCMSVNFVILIVCSLYLDTYFFSYTPEKLSLYFPLERAYWMPMPRSPQVDRFHVNQILPPPKPEKTKEGGTQQQKNPEKRDEMLGNPLVVLYGICKQINNHWIVNQLSLSVKYGEILTLYGHAGCGNEEILSIISGELTAEYGEVMREKSLRELMISRTTDVPDVNYLSVKEYLSMVCKMRGTSLTNQFLSEILSELDLDKVKNRALDLLSTTQKERVRVAAAFVGCPDVVLIDSPTRESPPQWKYMILNFIEKHKEKRSIVISSYDAEETEAVSDRIVLLSEGYVILNGQADTYRQSMNSVFEVRLWPLTMFSDEHIRGILEVMTLGDDKMREDVKYFETPNGKLRFLIPTVYRRCMQMLFTDLESNSARYQIAYFEVSKPSIHDVYTKACFEPRQYEPLANYRQLKDHYAKQQPINRTKHFFKNLFRILKDPQFLYQVAAIVALFLLLGLLTMFSYQETHTHYTHEISLEAHDYPTTIYCEDCIKQNASGVTYVAKLGTNELKENNALLFWRNNTELADVELTSISRGDDTFTMVIQNFAISQMIYKMTGIYPNITPTLESSAFRNSNTSEGFSLVFNDVNKNQAAMVLSESYSLMYILGVFQTFVFTLSALLPLRLVAVNMRPESMLFPWPRYLYFGLIFAANLMIFLVSSIILTGLLRAMKYFGEGDATGTFFHFLGAWFMVYISTLPLIYTLVYSVNNATAVIPTVMAVSSLLVNLPNMVSSFSAENAISLETLLKFVSWTCMLSPATSLQVLAAFLNAGEFHKDNQNTIIALTVCCCAQFWIVIAFVVSVFQPGFARLRQMWFLGSTSIWSSFTRGTILTPAARLRNLTVFPKKQESTKLEQKPSDAVAPLVEAKTSEVQASQDPQDQDDFQQKPSEKEKEKSRKTGGEDAKPAENLYENMHGKSPAKNVKPSVEFVAGDEKPVDRRRFKEPLSHITRIEEEMIGGMAKMRRWDDKQEVPIDNSAMYLLGDQTALKSALLTTIAEMNCKEQIAYVPYIECLPTIYTPLELLENVGACHGFEVTKEHIDYLLNAFGMLTFANTPIKLLTDADRRILMLLTKLVIKPSIIILDQLDMFLPHAKMMTVWSLCARLRTDGVGIIYTSRHSSFAEHTATCCAHMDKGQFLRTIPPSSIKADTGFTVLEIVPKPHVDIESLKGIFNAAFQNATYLPSMNTRFSVLLPHDDIDSMNKIMANVRAVNIMISRYSLRSLNFEEYISMSYE